MKRTEAYTPPEDLRALLAAAGPDCVLVGGQALAYWMDYFQVQGRRVGAISRDVDLLIADAGATEVVRRMARVIGGLSVFPLEQALTPVVGQAIRYVGESEYVNVDVLAKVHGIDRASVMEASLWVRWNGVAFRVMSPLDVLRSRLQNLYSLSEKQDDLGVEQLRAAIEVMQRMQDQFKADQDLLLRVTKVIARLAREDAGKKVARRFGIHVADAIAVEYIENKQFRELMVPRLLTRMSLERQAELAGVTDAQQDSHGIETLKPPGD